MSAVLYGLPNCDATSRARKLLKELGVKFLFHDLRADGLDGEKLKHWIEIAGWEKLLNKKSTTWRQLNEKVMHVPLDSTSVYALISEHITLMKRPVLEMGKELLVGNEVLSGKINQ